MYAALDPQGGPEGGYSGRRKEDQGSGHVSTGWRPGLTQQGTEPGRDKKGVSQLGTSICVLAQGPANVGDPQSQYKGQGHDRIYPIVCADDVHVSSFWRSGTHSDTCRRPEWAGAGGVLAPGSLELPGEVVSEPVRT